MKVIKLVPQGFCHGVSRALHIVKQVINDLSYPKPIYILGSIVHNKHIEKYFAEYGVISLSNSGTRLELLDSISSGTVIVTAHGVSQSVYDKLLKKELSYVDATCVDVKKVHTKVLSALKSGHVIYIGKSNHPESEGVLGLDHHIMFVETTSDVKLLPDLDGIIYVTNQTTLSFRDVFSVVSLLKERFPNLIFESDICSATTARQNAVMNQLQADLCYVVGDSKSSNANKLMIVGNENNIRTKLISSVNDIDINDLLNINSVSVTSAASTPNSLTNEVHEFLCNFDPNNKKTWSNITKLMPIDIL